MSSAAAPCPCALPCLGHGQYLLAWAFLPTQWAKEGARPGSSPAGGCEAGRWALGGAGWGPAPVRHAHTCAPPNCMQIAVLPAVRGACRLARAMEGLGVGQRLASLPWPGHGPLNLPGRMLEPGGTEEAGNIPLRV